MNAAPAIVRASAPAAVRIRGFEPGDAARICALFQRHTAYRRDGAFWWWLHRALPARPSLVAVAEAGGELVGHYAILPLDVRGPDGRLIRAGQGAQAFVSPEHRRAVSICEITAHAYRLAREAGLELVCGFPNAHYRLVQEKLERWRRVALFPAWTRAPGVVAPAGAELTAVRWEDDGERHAALALLEEADQRPGAARIAGLARWWEVRYRQHPHRPYEIHWLSEAGERRGLAVTKQFQAEGERRAHLIDHVLAPGVAPAGLLRAFARAQAGRADRLVLWPVEPAFTAALGEEGYQPDGFETWFGGRTLGGAGWPDELGTAAAWRLPMGFSDAF